MPPHAGLNIDTRANWTSYNATTDPKDLWNTGFKTGTTGTTGSQLYGAFVSYNATGGHTPETFRHVTIMATGGEMVSTNDVVTESPVHEKTMAHVAAEAPLQRLRRAVVP